MNAATETRAACSCGVPVFKDDDGVCDSCAREQRHGALNALRIFVDAFNLADDGSDDREVERWFRKPLKLARAVLAKAEGSAL